MDEYKIMKQKTWQTLLLIFFLFVFVSRLSVTVCYHAAALRLSHLNPWEDNFRQQRLSERSLIHLMRLQDITQMEISDLLTVASAVGKDKAAPDMERYEPQDLLKWKRILWANGRENYERIHTAYAAIWDDIKCFPVDAKDISYENSWMFERNYGGRRGHEGTDLMPPEQLSGHYRIVSMTDGVVEKVGWLPRGGWRIGIRSSEGGYFYYAHLDSYSRDFQIGEYVTAGTLLGKMGDTGYGPIGTRGKFDVHLHLGIYIRTEMYEEVSVNPYWVLKYAAFLGDRL